MQRVHDVSTEPSITFDPATGRELCRYDVMTAADMDGLLEQVTTAQKTWAGTPIEDRTAVLLRSAKMLRERSEELAALATAQMGKPIAEAIAEVEKARGCASTTPKRHPGGWSTRRSSPPGRAA